MNIVRISNNYSYLNNADQDLLAKLWKALRFRDPNCFNNPAYKQRRWDGYINFFNKNNGKFLTGLLPEVLYAIKHYGQTFKLDDTRQKVEWIHKSIDENFLKPYRPDLTLYDYQPDLVNQFMKANRGIIQAPTSAGKTYILISILKCLPPKTPVLFLTKSKDLVEQNYNDILQWGVPNVGRYYDKYKKPNYITCATAHVATFKALHKILPHFKALIVDEVHECMSEIPLKNYPKMNNAYIRCGISATPFKCAGKDKEHKFNVKGHFGAIIKTSDNEILTTKKLQDRNILSKSIATFYRIDQPEDIIYEPFQDAVTLGISHNVYFHQVIQRLARKLEGRTLILVERLDQGEMLKKMIPEASWISGKDKMKVRKEVIESLKSDDKAIAIVMQKIITAGINVFIHNLINAAGGKAEHSIIQRLGRGLRKADDKDILKYYDFIFATNEYLLNHSGSRVKTVRDEGHEVIIKDEIDF
jgi:superfamily II DNA or RNA helicase